MLEPLRDLYVTLNEIEVSISSDVTRSAKYTIKENENSYSVLNYYEPFEEYDALRISYIIKDEYSEETVESILEYLKDIEKYFVLYGEVEFWIYTENEDSKITFSILTSEMTIGLDNLADTIDYTERLNELETTINGFLENEYQ